MLNDFTKKIESGYWVHGNEWQFDWYIDVFFIEAMAYGKNPIKIGYMQPVLGDEFLNYKYETLIAEEFNNFFENKTKVKLLIKRQRSILSEAKKLIKELEKNNFQSERYKIIQKDLSLLMASVSIIFDKIITSTIHNISESEDIPDEDLIKYILNSSNKTELNISNAKLLEIYINNKSIFDKVNFKLSKLPQLLKQQISAHALRFGWLNKGERGGIEWKEKDFLDQMKAIVKRISKNYPPKKLVLKNSENEYLIKAFIEINSNDNYAADHQVKLDYLFQTFLKNTMKNFYVESILENLTYDEILPLITCPKKITDYKDRQNNKLRVAWPKNGKLFFYYFKNKTLFNKVKKKVRAEHLGQEIKGAVACKGNVEGIVHIVNDFDDLKYLQKGEILVTAKTQPRYVTFMIKAKAIVTDVGGITSHAAIIAREFNIPCIVGTKYATKILKSGDKIQINTDAGSVKIISN